MIVAQAAQQDTFEHAVLDLALLPAFQSPTGYKSAPPLTFVPAVNKSSATVLVEADLGTKCKNCIRAAGTALQVLEVGKTL